jgi:O-antigen ligase
VRPPSIALWTLVVLAALSPWAFGAVEPGARRWATTAALAASAAAFLLAARRRETPLPALPMAPAIGLLLLACVQLLPLPAFVHRTVAPGSYAVWHPAEPAAAAVLGGGARPISLDPDTTLRSLAWLAALLTLAALAAPEFAERRRTWRAVLVLAANGLALAAFGLWARGRFGTRLYGLYEVPTIAPFGPFVSKNHFAGYTAMAALLAFGLALALTDRREAEGRAWSTGPRAGPVVIALVAAAGMALGVLVSGSRGGAAMLLAGAAAAAALTLGSSASRRRLVAPAAVVIVLGALVLAVLPPTARERLRTATGASFRVGVWQDSLRLAGTSPLVGTGLGSFHDALPRVKLIHGLQRIEHAENEYVEVLADMGVLGLGLALAAAGGLFIRSAAGVRRSPPVTRGLAVGGLAGLVALAVHSLVDFDLRIPSNAALAAVLAAAGAGAAGTRPQPLARPGAIAGALGALLLLAGLSTLPPPFSPVARERVREAALSAGGDALALRLERAEAGLRRSLLRRPAEAEIWLQLAAVQTMRGDASAAGLARHALSLDPRRPDLAGKAERLGLRR